MDDLISRQAAIKWIKAECNPYGNPTLDYETSCRIMEHLDRMPSALPERKKGSWIQTGMGPQCSNCWYKCETTGTPHFCPSCGAEMR